MEKLNKIIKLNEELTIERIEEIKQNSQVELSKIAKELGHGAVAEEITHNRRSRENFEMVINGINFINLTVEKQLIVDNVKGVLIKLMRYLPENNIKQLRYLTLSQNLENALCELQSHSYTLDTKTEKEEWLEYYKIVKEYQKKHEEAKNELDKFVMDNLL